MSHHQPTTLTPEQLELGRALDAATSEGEVVRLLLAAGVERSEAEFQAAFMFGQTTGDLPTPSPD